MKKNIIAYIISFIIIILLFINKDIIGINVSNISIIFINNILSFLLPFYIISKILINYNLPYYIAKLFNNNIYVYIVILSILGGSPNNMIIIKDLLNTNIISIDEANKYVKCSFFTNPLFLYKMLNIVFSIKKTIIIIFCHYISNIIIYLINPIKKNNINKIKTISLNKVLINSIKEASIIMLNIYITIVLFNILISIIPSYFNNFKGLIELTYGINYIIHSNIYYKGLLSIIYVCFGGLSILFQIKEILDNTNIYFNNFIISRFYHIFISLIMYILLCYFFHL